jgi:hypothetical protein
MLAGSATFPRSDGVDDAAAGCDELADAGVDGRCLTLITTMVATTASTRPSGTSVATTRCRARNVAFRDARFVVRSWVPRGGPSWRVA